MSGHYIPSIHDKLFKQSMQDIQLAKDFFTHHLPEWIQSKVDLTQLTLRPGSFINPKFKAFYTDMLYQVPMESKPGYLYVLAEHKSHPSRFLPLQLLEYKIAIWRQHLDKQPKAKSLPLVYAVVFYHGRQSPYPYSMDMTDCFASPNLAKRLLHEPDQLIDVTAIPDEKLTQHERAALFQLAQKYIFDNDLLPFIQQLAHSHLLTKFDQITRQHLMSVIKYLLIGGESSSSQAVIETLIDALPDERGDIMTIAQQLKEEGKLEGELIGEKRGIKQGMEKKAEAIARNALKQGADIEFVVKITGLSKEQVEAIQSSLPETE